MRASDEHAHVQQDDVRNSVRAFSSLVCRLMQTSEKRGQPGARRGRTDCWARVLSVRPF